MRGRWVVLAVVLVVATGLVEAAAVPMTASAGLPAPRATALPAGPRHVAVVRTTVGRLNVRTSPSLVGRIVGGLGNGARVRVSCQVYGQLVGEQGRRGAMWDRLTNGRYVADAFLRWRPTRPEVRWCAGGVPATPVVASAGGAVNLRVGPTTRHRLVGRVRNGTTLAVRCQRWGDRIAGPRGSSYAWNRLANGRYISDALVTWRAARPTLPWCGQAPPSVPAATEAGFIARVARPAQAGMRRYRVPASVTIAQAILESGWGGSGLTRRDHNYFGIKCFDSPGPIAIGCRTYATSECGRGRCWRTQARFRAYRNVTGSMVDHGRFLMETPRYRRAFRYTGDANRFARAIHRAGYATSPSYASNLIRLMRRYDLYRFDR